VIERVKTLRQLDLKRITEEERKQAAVERRKEESARRLSEAHARAEMERKNAILAAEVRNQQATALRSICDP
jgi:DNA replicative helicase MCM subunit Mcm2 (Cdc46/Mcm family)